MRHSFGLVLFLFCNVVIFAQNTLKYNLKKGDVFTVEQEAQQIITQELDGETHELTNKIDGILEFKVLGKVAENYEIEFTFKDLNLLMTSNLQGELINIKAKEIVEGDMQSQIFNSLLDSPVKLILTTTGNILEVKGGDSLVSKMAKASGLTDEFSLKMMKNSLEKEFGSEALSNNYKQMTYIYPPSPLKIGDTWENEYEGKLNAKNKWTLDSLSTTHSSIHGDAKVVMDVSEAATTMKLSGSQHSEILADLGTGFITKMIVEGSSKGFSTMSQMGEKEIPTTIKSIITYHLIKA